MEGPVINESSYIHIDYFIFDEKKKENVWVRFESSSGGA